MVATLQGVLDPDAGDSHTFTLVDDAGGGRFQLVGDELQVADATLLDFETATNHVIRVRVTDAGALSFEKNLVVTVTNVNEAPTDVTLSTNSVSENAAAGTIVGTLQGVIDEDAGDTHTLSLTNDAGGRFQLVGSDLQVLDGSLLNYEAATSHTVTVQVTDAAGLTFDKIFTIDLTDVNEGLTLTGDTVAEGAATDTYVGRLDDSKPLTYSLVDDAGGRFKVVGEKNSGFKTARYSISRPSLATRSRCGRPTTAPGKYFDKVFTVTVTDQNEAPTHFGLSSGAVMEDAATDTVVGTLQGVVDQDAGDTHTFSLVDDAGGRFKVIGNQLQVADGSLLDFESAPSHDIILRATDAGGLFFDRVFTLIVGDRNEAPTDIALSASNVAEGAAGGTIVGTLLGVVDPDAGDTHTFSLLDDAGGRFQLVGDNLQVLDGTLLDFESATSHIVSVRVADAGGLTYDKTLTIDVTNANEAPTDFTLSASAVTENASVGTIIGTLLNAVDPDAGDTHTYSLTNDAGGRFQIVGNTLQVADGTLLDFEGATSHAVTVRVTDAGGLFHDRTFTIDVTDVNDAPSDVALSANTVAEGAATDTVIGTLMGVVDQDAGDTHSLSLMDGAGGRFKLVGAELQVADGSLLDLESASSHAVTVRVTDAGGLVLDKTFSIDLTNVNEAPTDVALSANAVVEGAAADTVIGTLQGIVDPDAGDTHMLSLIDDAGGRFKLVGDSLQVLDGTLLDFEDASSHAVTVRVTDAGALSYDEVLTIDVTDVNEAPTDVTLSANSVAEGAATDTIVGTLLGVVDQDAGDSHTLGLVDDAGGRFKLVGNTLQVADGTLLDFEGATSHAVTVRVTDAGGLSYDKAFTINLTDVNEAPTDVTLSASTVAEDAAADTVIGTFQGIVDPDAGDTHTFSLVNDAGGRFKLVGNALQVTDGALLDFETAASHTGVVQVTDAGGLSIFRAFTIDVTNVNEAPTDVALSANAVVEGAAADTVIGTLQGIVDPDAGDTHMLSLIDDAGGRFKLVGDSLQVLDGTLLDFEDASSHAVTVRVTDAGALSYDEVLTIDVTDVNEAPTGVALSASTVVEGAAADTVVGTLQGVVDPDAGDVHSFILLDDAAGRFKLVGAALQVADGSLLDFESAASHTVTVRVTDTAGLSYDETLAINVSDVNEAPTDLALSASTVAEGAAADTVIGILQGVVDPDAGDTHSLSLMDNAGGRFKLVGNAIQVADGALLDFESATSHTITVRVTDAAGLSNDKTFAIDVTDINEAPTDVALSANIVAEGAATDTVVGTLQGIIDPDAGDTHTLLLVDSAGGRFKLLGAELQVADGTLLDFEGASSHSVTVRVTDAGGLSYDKALTINVADVNEAPTDMALSANAVAEGAAANTIVGTFQGVLDPDAGDIHTLMLIDDAGGRFQLIGAELRVADGTLLDFEAATSHVVTVRVTDAAGLSTDKSFAIDVTDVNEAPTDVNLSASTVVEGAAAGTIIGTLQTVVDPDAGDTHTFSLIDDATGRFQLVGAELRVADGTLLDFESATSHTVTVRATDAAGLSYDKTFTIDIADVNETPLGVALSANTVTEGAATGTAVGTLQGVVDPDAGDSHSFSLVDDAGGRFKLVGDELQVADGTLIDFEGATNHSVTTRVTDAGGLSYDKTFTIDVADVNEAPTSVALSANSVIEGSATGTVVGALQDVVDQDVFDSHTYSLMDNAGGRFMLVGSELQVADGTLLDFGAATTHAVLVRVTDAGGLFSYKAFTIDVTDLEEVPTDVALSASTVTEGAAAGTVVGTLQDVVDPNLVDIHTFQPGRQRVRPVPTRRRRTPARGWGTARLRDDRKS